MSIIIILKIHNTIYFVVKKRDLLLMGGSRLLNTTNQSRSTNLTTSGPQSVSNPASSTRQNQSATDMGISTHREDDSGNGSQGSDSFHSQNLPQLSNIRKTERSNQNKANGKGLGNLIQRTFFRKGSRRKNKNKAAKSDASNKKIEVPGSIKGNKSQPTVYGGHFNGGGSISSRRRASQKRRRRLSSARRVTKNQETKGRLLTKADIGQPIPMDEEEKQNIISAKQWPTTITPSKVSKSTKGNYSLKSCIYKTVIT